MTYDYPRVIEMFVSVLHETATCSNQLLIDLIGQEAAWEEHVGRESMPTQYLKHDLKDERLVTLWRIRERANTLLLAEADHSIKKWAEVVSEVNEECKAQKKLVVALERQAESLHAQTINLSGDYHKLKTDAIDRFRAVKMLVDASIRNSNIGLNHRVRDERLNHLGDVIEAQIEAIGQSRLRSYDDDF